MENYEKEYKEALESAKKELQSCGSTDCDAARQIFRLFPELKESEDDRIRKGLIKGLTAMKEIYHHSTFSDDAIEIADAISFLEKQGEKSIPEDINEAALQYVDTCPVDGRVTHDNINEPYWNNHSMMAAYKAGWLEKQGKQKSSWSEEDEERLNSIMSSIEYCVEQYPDRKEYGKDINWLKSIKDRVSQHYWKPSEEEMIALHHAISGCSYDIESLVELETKLKEF